MYVVIQNTQTRAYYVEPDEWTEDLREAKQFNSSVDALEFLQETKLKGVHLLIKMGKPEFDVQLKVQPEQDPTSGSSGNSSS